MPAKNIFTRILPVAAIAAGLLIAAPAADAGKKKPKTVKATIALGDKRPVKARIAAKKPKAKAAVAVHQHRSAAVGRQPRAGAATRSSACTTRSAPRRACPRCATTRSCARPPCRTPRRWSDEGYFDHTSPNGDTFVDRILGAGYTKRNDALDARREPRLGHRRAQHPGRVMQSWMNSAGHKANILKKAYREVGIGIRLGVPSDNGVGATITADFGAKL